MTAFNIKVIALITMLIDHTGAVLDLPMGFRVVGRLAFPLFVYLIAEACHHTRSMEKLILRLGLFALISEIPFDLALNQRTGMPLFDFFNRTNIFYTLTLGVACVYLCKKMLDKKYWLLLPVPVIGAVWLAQWLSTDYGGIGVLFIVSMAMVGYLKENVKVWQLVVLAVFCIWIYLPFDSVGLDGTGMTINLGNVILLVASLVALPIIWVANGQRGRSMKWFFYAAYPVHLLVLAGIAWLI